MTIKDFIDHMNLELVAGAEGVTHQVEDVYIGDLLSRVMGNAKPGSLWVTIQTNMNVLGVAIMADLSGILIAENAIIPEETIQKANQEKIPLLRSDLTAYQLGIRLAELVSSDE